LQAEAPWCNRRREVKRLGIASRSRDRRHAVLTICDDASPMPTLITGASGFLGSRLARALCQRGEPVRALVRGRSSRRRIEDLSLEFVEGDVTDRGSIERALVGCERVVHAAAHYEIGTKDPVGMEAVNVDGTRHVLESAAARGIPAVYVSSVVALGPTAPGQPADETHWNTSTSRSPYEATKRAAHVLARELIRGGAPVRIALPVTIYGPDDPSLTGWFHQMYARGFIRIGALEHMWMSLVHVDDCAAGLLAIADRGRDGAEYILCERGLTFGEWFAALARASGSRPVRWMVPDWLVRAAEPVSALASPLVGLSPRLVREGMAMSGSVHWSFSGERARRELGWKPRPLDVGLAETIAWYRQRR
jgi:dihydroflavonol-4-reductase